MAISGKNIRTMLTLPRELKDKLEELAQKDSRSLNNLMVKVLSDYVRSLTS